MDSGEEISVNCIFLLSRSMAFIELEKPKARSFNRRGVHYIQSQAEKIFVMSVSGNVSSVTMKGRREVSGTVCSLGIWLRTNVKAEEACSGH